MKRGIKITIITVSIITLIIGTFFLLRYTYIKSNQDLMDKIHLKKSENFDQNDWNKICQEEKGFLRISCYATSFERLAYFNRTISKSLCEEISSNQFRTIEKILFFEIIQNAKESAKESQQRCLEYIRNN